jgi:hypothetical protein
MSACRLSQRFDPVMLQSPTVITRLSRVEASLAERLVTYYGVCLARMRPTRRHLYQRIKLLPSLLATHLEDFGPLTDVPVSISVCIKSLNALSYKTSFHGTIIGYTSLSSSVLLHRHFSARVLVL